MSNNKQSIMTNPFLQDAESTHEYNNQIFVVDYYPHPNGGTWQCCDANHYIRIRANTKEKAIQEAHNEWDKHKDNKQTNIAELAIKEYPFSNSERNAFINGYNKAKELDKNQTIEPPSHYDILDEAHKEESSEGHYAFMRGAKWMRRKTFGGNNEQQ